MGTKMRKARTREKPTKHPPSAAPRTRRHIPPTKAAKKETPRREKQEHGKSPQSAPRRVPDVKGKVTGGSHDKARPGRERAFIKKSGEGLDARARKARPRGAATTKRAPNANAHSSRKAAKAGRQGAKGKATGRPTKRPSPRAKMRKARTREKPAKRAPPRAGRECTSLKEGGEEWAPRCEKQEHGKSPQSAPRRVPDVKGKVTGGQPRQSAPRTRTRIHQEKRRRAGRQGAKGKVTEAAHKAPALRRAPGHERQGHGEAVTKKRALARMRSLPPGVAMRAARAPCVVSHRRAGEWNPAMRAARAMGLSDEALFSPEDDARASAQVAPRNASAFLSLARAYGSAPAHVRGVFSSFSKLRPRFLICAALSKRAGALRRPFSNLVPDRKRCNR